MKNNLACDIQQPNKDTHSANNNNNSKIKSPKRSNTFWCLFTVSKALNDNLVISVVSLYYHGVINAIPEHNQKKSRTPRQPTVKID